MSSRFKTGFQKSGLLGVTILALFILSITAGFRPLAMPDEGRYVGIAWEMAISGDWNVPLINGMPFFHKPPLFYWLTAASLSAFGPIELFGRIAPLLGGLVGSLSTYVFVRRWLSEREASYVLVTVLCIPLWTIGSQYANLDMLVAGLLSCTILMLAHSCLLMSNNRPYASWLVAAYVGAALSVLAKGLIGLVLPAVVIGTWMIIQGRWRDLFKLVSFPGIVLFFAVAGPWFVAMHLRFEGFSQYFFMDQHFRRFTTSGFNNVRPVYFYLAVLFIACLPWLPWLRLRSKAPFTLLSNGAAESSIRMLMMVWAAVILIFFSIPSSKLVGYILPVVIPICYLVATSVLRGQHGAERLWISAMIALVLSLLAVGWFAAHTEKSSKEIGLTLAHRLSANDQVLALANYPYDLAFYSGLKRPVIVLDQWSEHRLKLKDDWRKELVDASRFSPSEVGGSRLQELAQLSAQLCLSPRTWIIGNPEVEKSMKFPQGLQFIGAFDTRTLWFFERDAVGNKLTLKCEKTPSDDLKNK